MPRYHIPKVAPVFDGPPAPAPPSQVFSPLGQPDVARFGQLHASRFIVEAIKRLEGVLAQDSFLFSVGQPQSVVSIQIPGVRLVLDVVTPAGVPGTSMVTPLLSTQPMNSAYDAWGMA